VGKFSVFLALMLGASSLAMHDARAATFTNLYVFSQDAFDSNSQLTNGDGFSPDGFVVSGDTIYGTTFSGGIYGYGTVFRVNTDGTDFTNLFNFNRGAYDSVSQTYPTNTGDSPNPGLVLISNTLYGTTFYGGDVLAGSIFKINTDGSGFANIYSFHFSDGQTPQHGLTLNSNLLYGTTVLGATNGFGNIFTVNPGDDSVSIIYQFTNEVEAYGGLVMSGNSIYGFGRWGLTTDGLVYRLGPGGYAVLYTFSGTDGAQPESTPVLSGNTLFGVTVAGGVHGNGNVFRIDTDGLNYTNLYSFTPNGAANTDGTDPYDHTGLVLSGNKLYGTASASGSGGQGTVFQLNTDGSGFAVLHSFSYADGAHPDPIVLSDGTLYGGTLYGVQGIYLGNGALFALTLQPSLNISTVTNRAVLSWNDPSFSLYTSTNIAGIFTNITSASSPYTNIMTGPQRFFRLQSN
jgi:uncharacterized repeat protein (TIGR03803 family)